MSWQEELRRLDAELAEGRIEPADHRKQRDELLAQASGSTVPSPVPSPLRRPGEAWRSANPASHPSPQAPPPQRMESPRPMAPHQLAPQQPAPPMAPMGPPPKPHPPWQRTGLPKTLSSAHVAAIPDHMTTAPSPADITPTRYLRVDGPPEQSPGSRFPPVTPPGGEQRPPQHETEPDDGTGKHRWGRDDGESSGRTWTTWPFIALGVLVVLGMIIGATMWLGKDSAPNALSTLSPAPSQPPVAAAQPQLEDQVPPLPGLQHPESSTMSLARGLDLKLYPKEAAQVFSQHGVTQLVYRASTAGDTGFLGYAIPAENAEGAQAVVDYLRDAAGAGGFTPIDGDPATVTGRNGDIRMDGTWYTSGKVAVVLWASQPFAKDKAELKTSLDNALAVFRKALPPS